MGRYPDGGIGFGMRKRENLDGIVGEIRWELGDGDGRWDLT